MHEILVRSKHAKQHRVVTRVPQTDESSQLHTKVYKFFDCLQHVNHALMSPSNRTTENSRAGYNELGSVLPSGNNCVVF